MQHKNSWLVAGALQDVDRHIILRRCAVKIILIASKLKQAQYVNPFGKNDGEIDDWLGVGYAWRFGR